MPTRPAPGHGGFRAGVLIGALALAWISGAPLAAKPSTSPAPQASRAFPLGALAQSQPLATAAGGLFVVLLFADQLMLRTRPLWLLRLPDDGLEIPISSDGKVWKLLSAPFQFLKYRERVLDVWVAKHRSGIEDDFLKINTVQQRRHHLSLPVMVGNKLEMNLTPERLKELGAVGDLVMIRGEGGVGKTSLAFRIAKWALEGNLRGRPVLPVLVDDQGLQVEESLLPQCQQRSPLGLTRPPGGLTDDHATAL